jgi:hypothetical protein
LEDRAGAGATRALGDYGLRDMSDRDRFNKIIAVAVNPGAYEEEAVAALRRARELVKQNPSLAHPPPPAPPPPKPPISDTSLEIRLTNISDYWLNIVADSISQEAYGRGLKSKISYYFKQVPPALNVRCDGPKNACASFQAHLDWLIKYVNSQPRNP